MLVSAGDTLCPNVQHGRRALKLPACLCTPQIPVFIIVCTCFDLVPALYCLFKFLFQTQFLEKGSVCMLFSLSAEPFILEHIACFFFYFAPACSTLLPIATDRPGLCFLPSCLDYLFTCELLIKIFCIYILSVACFLTLFSSSTLNLSLREINPNDPNKIFSGVWSVGRHVGQIESRRFLSRAL